MKRIIAIAGIAAILGALPVLAQSTETPPDAQQADGGRMNHGMGPGHKGQHRGKHGGRHQAMIIDVNADGIINDDEAAAVADRAFNRIDRDRSGDVTEAEFTTVKDAGRWFNFGNAQDGAITDALKAKFATLDADKDGKLTRVEYFVDAKAKLAAADADKDGKVSPWEFRSAN